MKIVDNRALVAKKRIYNQPEVQVAHIAIMSIICASGGGGTPISTLDPDKTTPIQL